MRMAEQFEDRLRAVERQVVVIEGKQSSHEDICASRYASINEKLDDGKKRFGRLELLIIALILAVLTGQNLFEAVRDMIPGL